MGYKSVRGIALSVLDYLRLWHDNGVASKNLFSRSGLFVFSFMCFCLIFAAVLLMQNKSAYAADQENCLFCHQYPLLGTVGDNGTYSSYFIDDNHFLNSVHQELQCSECHVDIKKVPHETDLKINCTNECHIAEPTIGRKYSHKKIEEELKKSAHSIDYAYLNEKGDPSDFPECISCHKNEENRVILKSRRGLDYVVMSEAEAKCLDCHTDKDNFVKKNLVHVLRRTEGVYSQKAIMNMCTSCHNDPELNKRHEMVNAIYSYLENYHGKTMELGLPESPSCIDCHVKLGESPHIIKSAKDPESATNLSNRGKTCVRADCHPDASTGMGKSYIHVLPTDKDNFPIEFYLMAFFTVLTIASFVSLMLVLILELLRMIFPNFVLIKKERSNHDEH